MTFERVYSLPKGVRLDLHAFASKQRPYCWVSAHLRAYSCGTSFGLTLFNCGFQLGIYRR